MREPTLRDVIDRLQELAEEYGDGLPVRLAHQPNYPLEYTIGRDVETSIVALESRHADDQNVVYIGEGSQVGYLSGRAARALGWSDEPDEDDEDERS